MNRELMENAGRKGGERAIYGRPEVRGRPGGFPAPMHETAKLWYCNSLNSTEGKKLHTAETGGLIGSTAAI